MAERIGIIRRRFWRGWGDTGSGWGEHFEWVVVEGRGDRAGDCAGGECVLCLARGAARAGGVKARVEGDAGTTGRGCGAAGAAGREGGTASGAVGGKKGCGEESCSGGGGFAGRASFTEGDQDE